MSVGVIYLAFGRPYLAMALASLSSLRAASPDTPVCIVTNVTKELPSSVEWRSDRDSLVFLDIASEEAMFQKTRLFDLSPFEKTLFLDCDTLVLRDISMGDIFLNHFDIACRIDNKQPKFHKDMKILGDVRLGDLPHWNSGVLFFAKNERVRQFFLTWEERYKALQSPEDQPSLVEAIFWSDVRLLSLNHTWNGYAKDPHSPNTEQIIHHYMFLISRDVRKKILESDAALGQITVGKDQSTIAYLDKRADHRRKRAVRILKSTIKSLIGRGSHPQ